jgi:hypothetical protein
MEGFYHDGAGDRRAKCVRAMTGGRVRASKVTAREPCRGEGGRMYEQIAKGLGLGFIATWVLKLVKIVIILFS